MTDKSYAGNWSGSIISGGTKKMVLTEPSFIKTEFPAYAGEPTYGQPGEIQPITSGSSSTGRQLDLFTVLNGETGTFRPGSIKTMVGQC